MTNFQGWYKEHYKTNSDSEKEIKQALEDPINGESVRKDLTRRLNELEKIPARRCAVSADQASFLRRVLAYRDDRV